MSLHHALLALLVGACGSASSDAAPPAPAVTIPSRNEDESTRPSAETFGMDALDAVARDGRIVLVTPDAAAVRAVDIESGSEVWSSPLSTPQASAVIHDLGAGRLLVQVPGRFYTVDETSGAIVAEREGPNGWQFVHRNQGACALVSRCSLAPIACSDGRPLGEPWLGRSMHFEPVGPDHTGAACAASLEVLGASGDLALYVFGPDTGSNDAAVIAIDSHGVERYRSTRVACRECVAIGTGRATNGSVCWTTDLEEDSLVLRAFTCASGRLLFTRRIANGPGYRHPRIVTGWVSEPPGLFIGGDDNAVLLRPNGSVRWRRDVTESELALPDGLRVPRYPLALDRYDTLVYVDATTGRPTGTRDANGLEVRVVEDGSIALLPPETTSGRGGSYYIPPLRVFSFDRARAGSRVRFEGGVLLSLPGDGWIVGEHVTDDDAWLVVAEPRTNRPDRIHVLRRP